HSFPTRRSSDLVDRKTNKVLWSRMLPQQTILHVPEYQLPFLISLSRLRSRAQGGTQQSLRVEAIDCQTGDVLGEKPNILADRILQIQYERDDGVLELRGP